MEPDFSRRSNDGQYISIELWGRDHWSMLAYFETVQVERGFFRVEFNARMRQKRHHLRVMPGRRGDYDGIPMRPEHGSRLNNGTYIENHDDWDCVQDFANAGLLKQSPEKVDVNERLTLSDRGHEFCAALRRHKASGGSFSSFRCVQLGAYPRRIVTAFGSPIVDNDSGG